MHVSFQHLETRDGDLTNNTETAKLLLVHRYCFFVRLVSRNNNFPNHLFCCRRILQLSQHAQQLKVSYLFLQSMLSLWEVASLTMVAFWPHLAVDDFLLLSSSNIQTPGAFKYVNLNS